MDLLLNIVQNTTSRNSAQFSTALSQGRTMITWSNRYRRWNVGSQLLPESKQQSKAWCQSSEFAPKEVEIQFCLPVKLWSHEIRGILLKCYTYAQRHNHHCSGIYCQTLATHCETLKDLRITLHKQEKTGSFRSTRRCLVSPRAAYLTSQLLRKFKLTSSEHPPYLPDFVLRFSFILWIEKTPWWSHVPNWRRTAKRGQQVFLSTCARVLSYRVRKNLYKNTINV